MPGHEVIAQKCREALKNVKDIGEIEIKDNFYLQWKHLFMLFYIVHIIKIWDALFETGN